MNMSSTISSTLPALSLMIRISLLHSQAGGVWKWQIDHKSLHKREGGRESEMTETGKTNQ